MLKKRAVKLSLILIIILFLFLITPGFAVNAEELQQQGFSVVAENQYLSLYLNEENAEIAVKNKIASTVWYSNPPDRARDRLARGATRNLLNSQLSFNFFRADDSSTSMNSYADSVQQEQFEIEKLENGIRVNYIFGERWRDSQYLPGMILEKNFEEIVAELSSSDQNFMYDNFDLVKLEKLGDRERINISGVDKEQLFGEYTLVKIEDGESIKDRDIIYRVLSRYRSYRGDISSNADIRFSDIAPLIEHAAYIPQQMPGFIEGDIRDIFKEAGFDPDESNQDHILFNLGPQSPNPFTFGFVLDYHLEGEDLLVTLPLAKIDYPFLPGVHTIQRRGGGRDAFIVRNFQTLPNQLNFLPYFGAAGLDDEGYIFVPDGSGALINLNNQKLDESPYSGQLYGRDIAVEPVEQIRAVQQDVKLPVYGIKKNASAFLAIIEEGSALATIRADIAERNSSYNYVYPQFMISNFSNKSFRFGEVEDLAVNVYQPRLPEGNLKVRYRFLEGESADYVGMAKSYRQFLENRYDLKLLQKEQSNTILNLDIIGAIPIKRPILGLSREVQESVTTFKQAQKMLTELKESGIDSINVKYSGILEGGLNHYIPEKVKLNKVVGSEDEFRDFLEYSLANNINIFLETDLLNIHNYRWRNDFSSVKHASRYLSNQIAHHFEYNPASYQLQADKYSYLISPEYLKTLMEQFVGEIAQYELSCVAFRSLGTQLHSNMYRDAERMVDRQQALNIIQQNLAEYNSLNLQFIIEGGNDYLLPFVNHVNAIPLESSQRFLTDESIPFMQIVYSGFISYSTTALNQTDDVNKAILKMMETGAQPYFVLGYIEQSLLKDSREHKYYSVGYDNWKNQLIEMYQQIEPVLVKITGEQIIAHQTLKENVKETTFASGKKVIVNYNHRAVEVDNMQIEAQSYLLIEGENR